MDFVKYLRNMVVLKSLSISSSLYTIEMQAYVSQGSNTSNEFAVTNGVKEGFVLAPTVLSLSLSSFSNVGDGL